MSGVLLDAVSELQVADPDLGLKPLLFPWRAAFPWEQQPDLGAGVTEDQADAAPPTLLSLSGDEHRSIFTQLCNVLEPRVAVAFSSASQELRALTQALLQPLRAAHEAAAALCHKVGRMLYQESTCASRNSLQLRCSVRSCKGLAARGVISWDNKGLTAADLELLGTLGSVLPALERLTLSNISAGPDGVQRLAEGLGAGALPAVTKLHLEGIHVGDAGASALTAALGRGALPRLEFLCLSHAAIGDAGLAALAPALRRLPALETLDLQGNPIAFVALLVAPPPPGEFLGGLRLTKLKQLILNNTQITDAGCAALAAALDCDALPALKTLQLYGIPASAAAKATVAEALHRATFRSEFPRGSLRPRSAR